jgi:hypothetical protein
MSSRRIGTFATLGLMFVVAGTSGAQSAPSQQELDVVTSRGRALAGYQRAAWTASMQLLSTNPDPWKVQRYVAYHADSGWVVAFGRMNAQRDTFYVSHIGVPAAVNGQRVDSLFEFETFAQPGPDTDFLVRAAKAMDLAVLTHGPSSRPYSAAAIPNENGEWLVYLTPSADAANVWPLGDDVRYRVSSDGTRILETHRMHTGMVATGNDVSTTQLTTRRTGKPLHDLPEDSDVFHVLMSRQPRPMSVATRHFNYLIDVDGSIKLVDGKATVVGSTR